MERRGERVFAPHGHAFQARQFTFCGRWRFCELLRWFHLIPEGHARKIVFTLVPTMRLVLLVLVGRHPTERFKGNANPRVENKWIVDVPPIAAGHLANDSVWLIQIGHAKIGSAVQFQSPGGQEVIFGTGPTNRGLRFAINIDLLITLSKPGWAACAYAKHGADVIALSLRIEHHVILTFLRGILLAILRTKIH